MKEFLNTDNLFSADKRNQSKDGLRLANSILIEDLIETGRQADENNIIDQFEAAKLQAEINKYLYEDPIP